MRRLLAFLLFAAIDTGAQAQRLDPGDYIYPIRDVARLYAANFGEMRPAHFHAGIDIKTDGAEGKPLVAVADGYVSRVSLAAGGYGRAVYLTLRNGTTAVYGHLQRFRDDIEEHVWQERTARRANGVNLWFGPEAWPVKQGDVIGFSGNSGSSMGPHLHFEIRDTPTQRLYNVVREGVIRPEDNLPPRIMRLHYVEVDTLQGVPVRSRMESYAVVREAEGRYRLTREEPVGVGRKGYFVAEVTDRRNGVNNTFGIWRVTASADGIPYFEYRMDGFTHDLSRCCDAVSCYPLQLGSRNEVIRLARLAGAPDCFFPTMEERGLVRTAEGQQRRIRIEAEDDCGNRSALEFTIRGRSESFRAEPDTAAVAVYPDRTSLLQVGREARISIPEGTLYEPVFAKPERREAPQADSGVVVLSPAYRFLSPETPLRHAAAVTIRTHVPRPLQLQTVLAVRNRQGRLAHVGGTYANGAVTATTYATGDLTVVADTLPPSIRPLFTEGADLSKAEGLRFRVADNFSGIAAWTLRIDGEWVPCDRFPVKGTLVHFFGNPATRRKHEVQLSVRDGCGNTAHFRGIFYR
ncbi:M23 family metallopeptidase [Alistipes provencensis]|uniref:M23 family metallopeptidase n=1 Tax=Alistipes provencensis TaxID=1816676 RepID=UPI0007ECDCE5|nr:M23 family metallopeptidase [Alistipes provencensis]